MDNKLIFAILNKLKYVPRLNNPSFDMVQIFMNKIIFILWQEELSSIITTDIRALCLLSKGWSWNLSFRKEVKHDMLFSNNPPPFFVLLAQITYIHCLYMPLVAVLSSYIYFFMHLPLTFHRNKMATLIQSCAVAVK